MMVQASGSLQLDYVFTSVPYPIRASVDGSNPNTISLQVMVSRPTTDPVELTKIEIQIPVGEKSARALSSASALPTPAGFSSPWEISSSASTVTVQSQDDPFQMGTQAILFTLPEIPVNTEEGVVPITITEFAPAGKTIDSDTYSLVKQPADFPVTEFKAQPDVLDDLDQPVTLYWTCSDQGDHYVYNVHSDSWRLKDCLSNGDCYSCQDGKQGVQTSKLAATTTFALDVIQADAKGHREIRDTLYTTVRVQVPSISTNSTQSLYFGGYCRLRWLAFNAAKCTVMLDSQTVIDDNAPTDTYEQGYLIHLPKYAKAGTSGHQLTVTAYATSGSAIPEVKQMAAGLSAFSRKNRQGQPGREASGSILYAMNSILQSAATATHNFSVFAVHAAPSFIGPVPNPGGMDITSDSNTPFAFVIDVDSNKITVLDLAQLKVQGSFAVGETADKHSGMGVTPDNQHLLVTNAPGNSVSIVDIHDPTQPKVTHTIQVGSNPSDLAILSDGQHALVMNQDSKNLSVLDITGGAVSTTIDGVEPGPFTLTPDDQFALVVHADSQSMTVIDIAQGKVAGTIDKIPNPRSFTVTLDSTSGVNYAFVVNSAQGSKTISVVDVNHRQLLSPITVGDGPTDVATTPDGKLALVANHDSKDVSVLDISDPSSPKLTDTLKVDPGPVSNIITSDGALALVAFADATPHMTVIDVNKRQVTGFDLADNYRYVGRAIITPNCRYALLADRDNNRVVVL